MPERQPFFPSLIVIAFVSILVLVHCQPQSIAAPPAITLIPTAAALSTSPPTATPTPLPLAATLPRPPASPTPSPGPTSLPPTSPAAPTSTPAESNPVVRDLGLSGNGYPIQAFQMGSGDHHLMIVGGIHGGYEWNSILLAYGLWDYFADEPERLPEGVRLTIVPALNLDGQFAVTGQTGRFTPADVGADTTIGRLNGRGVDLNRNWPCNWQPTGTWRQQPVSGGSEPFSEIENRHLNYFITLEQPDLVIFLHSALPGVLIGSCDGQEAATTRAWAQAYATASGYPLYDTFAAYEVTGDASDYLAIVGIASFTVELTDHFVIELDRNVSGVRQVLAAMKGEDN